MIKQIEYCYQNYRRLKQSNATQMNKKKKKLPPEFNCPKSEMCSINICL